VARQRATHPQLRPRALASLLLLRLLGPMLFGVSPNDFATYAVVLTLVIAVAAVAAYVPARRASRVEPLIALRQE